MNDHTTYTGIAMTAAATEHRDDAPAGGKSLKKLVIISVLLAGAAGAGWYFLKGRTQPATGEVRKVAAFLDVPDITVNLAQTPGQERQAFLRLKLALELADPKLVAQIQPLMPRLLDTFQVYLRELRSTDLEGSAGVYRLKEELVRRTNIAIHPAKVEAILFKDVLVQ